MIEVRGLSVRYGDFELKDISLELHEGACLAILGPSGAGKSLLLESVMGARRPLAGEVLLSGQDVTALPPELRRIAYIPQDAVLFPHLSVARNVAFGLERGIARRRADQRVGEIAELLGIEHLLGRADVRTLSGGERQRVALARALVVEPRVLFLDEPFTALDAPTRTELLFILRELRRRTRPTLFLVTHELDEACALGDSLAVLSEGRVLRSGPTAELLRDPGTQAVARILGYRNFLRRAHFSSEQLAAIPGLCARTELLASRPDALEPTRANASSGAGLRARLMEFVPLVDQVSMRLVLADGTRLEARVPLRRAVELELAPGCELDLRFRPDAWVPLRALAGPAGLAPRADLRNAGSR